MKSDESLTRSYDEANYPKEERNYDYYLRRMKEERALEQQVGGGRKDIEKAIHYAQLILEMEYDK